MPKNPDELIAQTLAGDQHAFAELTKLLFPIFKREAQLAAFRRDGNREDVFDMVNQMFVDLISKDGAALRKFDARRGSFESFFRQFARWRWMNYVRKHRKEQPQDPSDMDQEYASTEAPVGPVERVERERTLRRIEEVLSQADFDLFKRRYLEQGETDEICKALGISQDAFFQRIRRMLNRLREHGILEKNKK